MLNNRSRREKILIIIFTIFLILYLYFDYIYFPLKNKVGMVNRENNKMKSEIEIIKKTIEDKEVIRKNINILEKKKDKIINFTSGNHILKLIKNLVSENNLEILNFNSDNKKNNQEINLEIKGSFKDICNFLEELEYIKTNMEYREFKIYQNSSDLNLKMLLDFYGGEKN